MVVMVGLIPKRGPPFGLLDGPVATTGLPDSEAVKCLSAADGCAAGLPSRTVRWSSMVVHIVPTGRSSAGKQKPRPRRPANLGDGTAILTRSVFDRAFAVDASIRTVHPRVRTFFDPSSSSPVPAGIARTPGWPWRHGRTPCGGGTSVSLWTVPPRWAARHTARRA